MTKQKKYRIVMDMRNNYNVVFRGTSIAVYRSENHGQAGLEACEEWIAKQPEE